MISKKTFTAVFGALLASLAASADVFSDAATWHQGFYGSGTLTSGSKTAFPDKLRAGDSSSNYHSSTVVGNASGISLESGTVVYPNPYSPNTTLVSRNETFAHLPQSASGSYAGIQLVNPFAVTNTESFTFFVRLKWDGTVDTAPAVFLYAGYGNYAGFRLGVQSSGKIQLYAQTGATATSTWVNSSDSLLTANVWTDLAVVVEDHKMTLYTLTPGAAMKTTVLTDNFANNADAKSYLTAIKLGSQDATDKYRFAGNFHAFASWSRALSEDEVKQVFAYPSTADLVRLGTKNGSSLEFNGATLGGVESGSATEDWAQIAPSLTAGAPSQSIPFTVPDNFAMVSQVLRVAFAPNSAAGKVNVSIGGTSVGELTAAPGKSALLTIKGDLLTSGAKTLVLARDAASSGEIVFDALALGGGLQVGNANNDTTEFPDPQPDSSKHYYAYCTNAVYSNVRRDINYQGNVLYNRQYIHLNVPDEIGGSEECTVRFKARIYPGPFNQTTYNHTLALYLNEGAAEMTSGFTSGSWQSFECEVPATKLAPGDNVICFANISTTGGYVSWCHVDYYRFETIYKKKLGFAIIFR